MFTAKPERTYGLVVGIEQYQESSWNIKGGGPALDAIAFARWLCQRGVPMANIRLCLSPLDEHRALVAQSGLAVEAATEQNLSYMITDLLSQETGDLLYIFWAGHGLITSERERRLFCADATKRNWQNLDFNSLLIFLSSEAFKIRRHICIIDACANYIPEAKGRPTNLEGKRFSSGKPNAASQQFVLLATREGELAKVNAEGKTGYFSQAVREALAAAPLEIWQGNMQAIAEQVKQRFVELDKQQLPTYFYYRTWDGDRYEEHLGRLTSPANLPRSGVIEFVGRESELEELHQHLQQRERVAISAISGMGGIGKTELALQYAQKHREGGTYPGGICWLQARDADIGTQIVAFAKVQLGLQLPEDWDLPSLIAYCWRNWQAGNVLVVLDDVSNYPQIASYLPPSEPRFKVIMTTRQQWLGGSFQRLSLDVLDLAAALKLLASFVGDQRLERERDAAEQLCADLGFLPLGLELVGRYLQRKPDLSLAEMRRRLAGKLLAHRSLQERSPEMTAKRGVAAAFELSWQELNEPAKQLCYLLSLFALAPIPWILVEQCLPNQDSEELEDLRDDFLVNLSLLQRQEQATYQLHQLIREFISDKFKQLADVDNLKRGFCAAMVAVAQGIPQTPTQEQIVAVTPAIPHLAEVGTAGKDWLSDEELIWPFVGLGRFYDGQGVYEQALPWYEQCLSATRERWGESHPDVATSLNNLAALYKSQGRYSEAEALYLQALELTKRLRGESHPDVAGSLNNLAALYKSQGRYSEAEPLYLQALELTKRLQGASHPDFTNSLNNLAALYYSQGRYSEAEPLFLQALELTKRLQGESHPNFATTLNNLAGLYKSQGRYSKAEPLYLQALELRKRLQGESHPDVATSLNNLALLYYSQGRYSEAEPLYLQALELRKRLLGEFHPDVAGSLNNLALLYHSQGRYSEAEPLYLQALELTKRLQGASHPDVATSLNNLALLYYLQGRYSEAEPLYLQALKLRKRLLGESHPNVATSLNNLALLYDSQRRYSEAELFYLQALEIAEQQLGANHPNTITIRKNLQQLRGDRHS